jgi:hypothetical protein
VLDLYFSREEWEPVAPGFESIADARELRRRFLLAFEEGEVRRLGALDAYLPFVIVGAGQGSRLVAGIKAPRVRSGAIRQMPPHNYRIVRGRGDEACHSLNIGALYGITGV